MVTRYTPVRQEKGEVWEKAFIGESNSACRVSFTKWFQPECPLFVIETGRPEETFQISYPSKVKDPGTGMASMVTMFIGDWRAAPHWESSMVGQYAGPDERV